VQAVEVEISPAALPDYRLLARRPAAFLAWAGVGCVGTYVDKIHERLGVVAYPDPTWIGERLPVSPVYVAATLGFFTLYTGLVGHRAQPQGLFGGARLRPLDFAYAHVSWIVAYCVSGVLGSPRWAEGVAPWACAVLLAAWAAPALWSARKTRLPLFAAAMAVMGVSFEWAATARALFTYPVCPSRACQGATVPLVWLPLLYVHAALYVHRMLGGRHALSDFGR
jgi:hypothetical protein